MAKRASRASVLVVRMRCKIWTLELKRVTTEPFFAPPKTRGTPKLPRRDSNSSNEVNLSKIQNPLSAEGHLLSLCCIVATVRLGCSGSQMRNDYAPGSSMFYCRRRLPDPENVVLCGP